MYKRRSTRAAWTAHRRLRARAHAGEDRAAARPRRAEGLDAARLGGRGRAARRRRQLAADRAVGARLRPAQPGAARDDARRHGRACAADFVARRALGRRVRLRLAGAALRARLPAVRASSARSPTGATTSTAAALAQPLPLSARGVRARCARCGRRTGRCRCASPRTTGRPAATRPTTRSRSRALFKAAGADLIDVSSGQTTREAQAGLRPHVPDAVRRPHPQRGRHRDHGGRRDLRARSREQHHRWPGAPTCARSRGRTSPIRTGRCTRRRSSATHDDARGRSQYLTGKAQLERNLARARRTPTERPEANG